MTRPFIAALAFALACATSACSTDTIDAAPATNNAALHDPGYSLIDAEITETGELGRPRYTVNAARAQQNPATGQIALEGIRMRLQDQRGNDWRLRANSGKMTEGASMVALRGAVTVDGSPGGGTEPVQLRTEELDVDTETQRASTRAIVTITMSGRLLTAQGMHADLKTRQLRLESNVHGRFTP